jgi:hypothetical protein
MVLQAVVEDRQLLLSLPVTPLTCQVVATAAGAKTAAIAVSSKAVSSLYLIIFHLIKGPVRPCSVILLSTYAQSIVQTDHDSWRFFD